MVLHTIDLKCPGCGSPIDTNMKVCPYCKRPVVISSFTSVYDMDIPLLNKYAKAYASNLEKNTDDPKLSLSIALCYLKLKQYNNALPFFENSIKHDFNNSETLFYSAVCLLKGKKPFVTPMSNIKKAIEYINSAIMIEPRGIYYYFLAYIKYDFYKRKSLRISPDYADEFLKAKENNLTHTDVDMLFDVLGVDIPDEIKLD